jgi:nucleotide-binding universal stress UspA family protein
MPGIIVGMDGSADSQRALLWAMNEAVAHHAPLTVLSVRHCAAITYTEGDLGLDQWAREVQAWWTTRRAACAGRCRRSPCG